MRREAGVVLVALVWAAVVCGAQSTTVPDPLPKSGNVPAPCSVAAQPVPCSATPRVAGKPNASEQFPFPGEQTGSSIPLTQGASDPTLSGVAQVPGVPSTISGTAGGASSGANPDAAASGMTTTAFPFPGEEEKSAAVNGSTNAGGGTGAGGSSSSSSSGTSSGGDDAASAGQDGTPDEAGLQDKGSEGTTGRHLLHRVNPVGTKLQTADERVAEDLSVAKFYTDSGNLQGAYLRSQDAVQTTPDDPDAHFALAEAAARLNKREEAIAEYKACLKLDPVDKEAKEARKALERFNP